MFNLFRAILLFIAVFVSSSAFSEDGIELTVRPGEVKVLEAGQTEPSGHLGMSITMLEIYSSDTWAPYAYIGFIDHDEKNSFRLFVSENKRYSDGLIAGYEYYRDGKLVKRSGLIHSIPVGTAINFSVSWDENGNFTFSVLDGDKQTVATNLRNVSQTLSVSGARAAFR